MKRGKNKSLLFLVAIFAIFILFLTQRIAFSYASCIPGEVCGTHAIGAQFSGHTGNTDLFAPQIYYKVCQSNGQTCLSDSTPYTPSGQFCFIDTNQNESLNTALSTCPSQTSPCDWGNPPAFSCYNGQTLKYECYPIGFYGEEYDIPICQGTASGGFCGDGTCNNGETCSTCSQDCGGCGGTCNFVTKYPECETAGNPTFCETQVGPNNVAMVTQTTCGYSCQNVGVCNSSISGLVFTDSDGDGQYKPADGDTPVNSSLVTKVYDGNTHTNTASNGTYSFTGLNGPTTYNVTISNPPAGYKVVTAAQQVKIDSANRNPSNIDFGIQKVYTISGSIFKDYNHNGTVDGADATYTAQSITVNLSNGLTAKTDASGNFTFANVPSGNYTLSVDATTLPANYAASFPNGQPIVVTNTNLSGQEVGITPLYSISGTVFNDADLNHCYNPSSHGCTYPNGGTSYPAGGDTGFTNPGQASGSDIILSEQGGATVHVKASQTDGTFTSGTTLTSGTYTVAYDTAISPLPAGYRFVTNNGWVVVLGDPAGSPASVCSPGASEGACANPNNGSLGNVNFGLSNETAWVQGVCADMRFGGGYSQSIPASANCGGTSAPYAIEGNASECPSNPGVLYSGSTNPSYGTGLGASTPTNQVIGNALYPENFTPRIPNTIGSSYSFVNTSLNNLTTPAVKLTSICPDLKNCVISNLTPGGVYTTTAADGAVSLSVRPSGPLINPQYVLGNANYTFVIGGDLTFTSQLLMPTGFSDAFISGGNIHVAGNVGESNWDSTSPDLEGFFSADNNFYIDSLNPVGQQCVSSGQPSDKKLNIQGSVITGAGGGSGSIINSREGCLQDLTCPAATFTTSPQQLLHVPSPLKPPYTFWQELNP